MRSVKEIAVKKTYLSPEGKQIRFFAEEILGPSASPILPADKDKTPAKPATEFGNLNIF